MRNMLNWFKTKPIKPVVVPSTSLTLDQWRKQENLVAAMQKLMRDQTFQLAMSVMRNSHPCRNVFGPIGVSPNDRLAHQAKIEGYEIALNNLEAMAAPYKLSKPLTATFEPPETK